MCVLCSAMMSGSTIVLLKLLGELIQSGSAKDNVVMMVVMVFTMGLMGLGQMHMLNFAMKLYDQIEAVPVYQTCLMIMWIFTGLVILDEKQFYTGLELTTLAGCVALCCVGIKLLTLKTKLLRAEARRERADSYQTRSVRSSSKVSEGQFERLRAVNA